jgi:hypothetical protein
MTLAPLEYNMPVSLHVRERGSAIRCASAAASCSCGRPWELVSSLICEVGIARSTTAATLAVRTGEPLFRAPDPALRGGRLRGQWLRDAVRLRAQRGSATGGAVTYPCTLRGSTRHACSSEPPIRSTSQDAQGNGLLEQRIRQGSHPVLNATDVPSRSAGTRTLAQVSGRASVHHVSNHAGLQTAAAHRGPWQERVEVDLPMPGVFVNLDAREQPELGQRCGQRIFISSFSPTMFDEERSGPARRGRPQLRRSGVTSAGCRASRAASSRREDRAFRQRGDS